MIEWFRNSALNRSATGAACACVRWVCYAGSMEVRIIQNRTDWYAIWNWNIGQNIVHPFAGAVCPGFISIMRL